MRYNSISEAISEYKNSLAQKRLPYFECKACSHKFPYPRTSCLKCGSKEIELKIANGSGKIHTMTVLHRARDPSVKVPFVVAMVELSEGLKVMANAAYPTNLTIGDDVLVRFESSAQGIPRIVVERVNLGNSKVQAGK
jgi:uncharacterized protein